jgi:hypothetical protein
MFEVTARGGRREWRVEISDAKMGPGCENEVVVSAGAGQIPIRCCMGIDTADIDINESPSKSWEVMRSTTRYPALRRAVLPPSHVCPASCRCHAVICSCAGGIALYAKGKEKCWPAGDCCPFKKEISGLSSSRHVLEAAVTRVPVFHVPERQPTSPV